MEGLASIALAVDFLEKREQGKAAGNDLGSIQSLAEASPFPKGSSFANTPRRVSSDSVCEETSAPPAAAAYATAPVSNVHAVATQPAPAADAAMAEQVQVVAAEDLSPEMISQMVASLSDDGEFQGPPPAPPAPTDVVSRVIDCDVLCGRGGETNHHSGNVKYRSLVKKYQPLYIMSKRRDKPLIASKIVRLVRHAGGRFLRKDKTNTWRDVGNTKAREKTSQALREGAPDLRGSPPKGAAGSKGEQASSSSSQGAAQLPPSSQVLGVTKHTGYPAGMAQYVTAPSLVETRPGEVDRFYGSPAAKKMRFGGSLPLQVSGAVPHMFGGAQHAGYMHAMGPPAAAYRTVSGGVTAAPVAGPKPAASPRSFATTVSADDDDSRGSEERAGDKPRGPRLKLLKKRLQEEQASN